MRDFTAGVVGGVGQCIVGHPMDTMKVAMQIGRPGCTSTAATFRAILTADGPTGFYRGVASPLAGLAVLNATLFTSFRTGMALFDTENLGDRHAPIQSIFAAGAFAGVCASFVEGPVDLFKSKMQSMGTTASGTPQYKGTFDCAKQIVSRYGIRGFYQGLQATIIRNTMGYSLYFGFYQWGLRKMYVEGQKKPPIYAILAAGGLGGMAYWLPYPLDIIKTRIQTDHADRSKRVYRNYMHAFTHTLRTAGVAGLTAGLVPCLLRAFFANGVCFLGYDFTMQYFETMHGGQI